MSPFDEIIEKTKTSDFRVKKQFLQYLAQMSKNTGRRFSQEDTAALLEYAYGETENLLRAIPAAETYKEKDLLFECEHFLFDLIMVFCPSPDHIPQENLLKIKALAALVQKERYIENTLDDIFGQTAITETDVNRLLYWVRQTADEYQKGKLFEGLIHYQKDLSKLDCCAEKIIADYIAEEMERLKHPGGEDAWNTLELAADVAKHFPQDNVTAALKNVLLLGRNHINFYAVGSLCKLGLDIPQAVVESLARDLEYANMTYSTLQQYGKASLFPAECATEEYLAKSDMVRWLTYPTELGKAPDEIEYIGKTKKLFSKEVFHVFKYRSDSDNLDDELKNTWLIGWSSNKGGTFSNFDAFAPFEQETAEKTLKMIMKKLIG